MPYRILLKRARGVVSGNRRTKEPGVGQISVGTTDRVEVRNGKGLLLFYRPQLPDVQVLHPLHAAK